MIWEAVRESAVALALAGAVVGCGGQSRDDLWTVCTGTDPAAAVPACTSLLAANTLAAAAEEKAFHARGTARFRRGEWAAAVQDFDNAIQRNPTNASSFHNRALAYAGSGDYDEAIRNFDRSIALNGDYDQAFDNRGVVYRRKGDYRRAIEDFNRAVELNPRNPVALNNRGFA